MPPPKDRLVDENFTRDPITDKFTCKHCDSTYKNLQLARARGHLSGRAGAGVAACPKVPEALKEKLCTEIDKKLAEKIQQAKRQDARQEALKRASESDGDGLQAERPPPTKQLTMEEWQTRQKWALDEQFATFISHAGIPTTLTLTLTQTSAPCQLRIQTPSSSSPTCVQYVRRILKLFIPCFPPTNNCVPYANYIY